MRNKTGEKCTKTGNYDFDGYVDGTKTPAPTSEESVIPMKENETFPPVKSSERAAWWKK